jgi:hypothetical protein
MTLELIAEQLWNRGWHLDIRFDKEMPEPWSAVIWNLKGNLLLVGDIYRGRGPSALVAVERARAELDRMEKTA